VLEMAGNKIIAWAEPPAAASMGEDHDSKRLRRKAEYCFKRQASPRESYGRFIHRRPDRLYFIFIIRIRTNGQGLLPQFGWLRNSRRFTSHQSCRGGYGKTLRVIAPGSFEAHWH